VLLSNAVLSDTYDTSSATWAAQHGYTAQMTIFGPAVTGDPADTLQSINVSSLTVDATGTYSYEGLLKSYLAAGWTNVSYFGGSAAETLSLNGTGTTGLTLTLDMGGGNDIVAGTSYADVIYGGTGDDRITGNLGGDTIYGQGGSDTYIYQAAGGVNQSKVATTTASASGFDTVYIDNSDTFDFNVTVASLASTAAVNSSASITIGTTTGTALLSALNSAFTGADNNTSDIEAAVIDFQSGPDFLVVDTNGDQAITSSDYVVEIVGSVNTISIVSGDIKII
jgi:Ca2+-binding RTX toxin-like protein